MRAGNGLISSRVGSKFAILVQIREIRAIFLIKRVRDLSDVNLRFVATKVYKLFDLLEFKKCFTSLCRVKFRIIGNENIRG